MLDAIDLFEIRLTGGFAIATMMMWVVMFSYVLYLVGSIFYKFISKLLNL